MPIQAAIVATRSKEGKELALMIQELLKTLGFEISVYDHPTQSELAWACIKQDVVIVDASVELDGTHNYAAFTAQPQGYDHVLVVSRTYLPQNFYGLREGGAPPYPFSQNNQAIMAWIREQVADLLPNLPRTGKNIWSTGIMGPLKGLGNARARASQQHQIFISFRNSAFDSAKSLKTQLEEGQFHSGQKQGVLLINPNELAFQGELLTFIQRWQLMGILEERMRIVKEVWICDSADYFQSWWTAGEMLIMAYYQSTSNKRPILKLYNPLTQKILVEPSGIIPHLTYDQRRKLDQIFSTSNNYDPLEKSMNGWIKLLLKLKYSMISEEWLNAFMFEDYLLEQQSWKNNLDFDQFVQMLQPKFILAKAEITNDIKNKKTSYYAGYKIEKLDHPRYFWYPTRMGLLNGPEYSDELTIAREVVYRAEKSKL